MNRNREDVGRRDFLRYAAAFGLSVGFDQFVPAYARVRNGLGGELAHPSGKNVTDLRIGRQKMTFGDRQAAAVVINGSFPGGSRSLADFFNLFQSQQEFGKPRAVAPEESPQVEDRRKLFASIPFRL